MANNIFLGNDPLLYQGNSLFANSNPEDMQQQFNDVMSQYKMLQQQQRQQNHNNNTKDYIGELDTLVKSLTEGVVNNLNDNTEFQKLNIELKSLIQAELMSNIKWKINSNNNAVRNIERQTEIIKEISKTVEDEQRQNLSELNDYVKHYSNITFDEYKRIKNGETKETNNNKTKTTKK